MTSRAAALARTASSAPSGEATRTPAVQRGVEEALRSPGRPLDPPTRAVFEARFGHDFAGVRVHADGAAAASARLVQARAYAVGEHLVFGAGEFAPGSPRGRGLLAHELTHTVQQRARGGAPGVVPTVRAVSDPTDAQEREAERIKRGEAGERAPTRAAPGQLVAGEAAAVHEVAPAGVLQRDALEGAVGGAIAGAVVGGVIGFVAGGPIGALVGAGVGAVAGGVAGGLIGGATGGALPNVSIGNFRNSGDTHAENNCALCPRALGVLAGAGQNRMELRGDLTGHRAGIQYDFKRTKERGTWKLVGGTWTQLTHVGPGADDDSHDQDESLTPVSDHIYVFDEPGFPDFTDPVGDASATEAVYKSSFIESCNVRDGAAGGWTKRSNTVEWHSISWLEKSGGSWRRKAGASEIELGTTTVGTGNP